MRIAIPTTLSPHSFALRVTNGRVECCDGLTMGTNWSVRYVVPVAGEPKALQAGITNILDHIVAQMSHWEPSSDLCRFNRSMAQRWHRLPPEMIHVLDVALRIAAESEGAFDPTMGALVDIWGFGPPGPVVEPPSQDAVEAAKRRSGWQRMEIDTRGLRAHNPGGVQLDFSGIAKGFAVDQLAAYLAARGIAHFLVEIGGELCGHGLKPDGQPWWVDAEIPPGLMVQPLRIALHQLSIATSGDYRRWFTHDAQRYAHSIDPRTGRPVDNDVASVTVLHPSAMFADAYATAITILGVDAGIEFANAKGLAVHMLIRQGEGFREVLSAAIKDMLG